MQHDDARRESGVPGVLRRARLLAIAAVVVGVSGVAQASSGNAVSVLSRGSSEVSSVLTGMAPLIARNRQGPTRASRIYGIVGYAMLAASTQHPSFLDSLNEPVELGAVPVGFDDALAAVSAGTTVVRTLMPTQLDRTTYAEMRDKYLSELVASATEGTDVRTSIARGMKAATAVLARAKNDGLDDALAVKYVASDAAGAWVPTPPGFQGAIDPGWGTLRTYLPTTSECTLPAPPKSSDAVNPFGEAANEVRDIAASLTNEQKLIARFWDDGRGRSSTPSGHWIEIAARAVEAKQMPVSDTVAMFGTLTMALADGVVVNWREKYKWTVERPVTVIERTDAQWNSYLVTPAFPEYPSGHSTISRIAADVLTKMTGDWSFTDQGWGLTPASRKKFELEPRSFVSFRQAADEAGLSRVYGGIHYRFSIDAGARLGACVAGHYVAS